VEVSAEIRWVGSVRTLDMVLNDPMDANVVDRRMIDLDRRLAVKEVIVRAMNAGRR
jgi:hypothetical protein